MKERETSSVVPKDHSAPKQKQSPSNGVFDSLQPNIRKAVVAEGYTNPTPIQEQCVPHLLDGRDVMGCAQTGTGKTAAFALPLLQRLSSENIKLKRGTPRALILAPTRELAAQIGESIQTYGRFLRLRHTVVYGGVKQFRQVKALNRGVDILVATPGRLLDLIRQGFIHLDKIETFILDEVDRMLDMGFIPDIKRILAQLPSERQSMFFSATMAPKMVELAHSMVRDPVKVTISPEKPAVEKINQKTLFVEKKSKDALLVSLINQGGIDKALVFTQMKHVANKVVKKLGNAGIRGVAIHGNKSQVARTKALDGFKRGRFSVLVATDVAARGLDVDDISHVINYDLPVEAETYVHRIGRTARAGACGDALSFCCPADANYLRDIERLLGTSIPVELEHEFHSDEAFRSTQSKPKSFHGNKSKKRNSFRKKRGGPRHRRFSPAKH